MVKTAGAVARIFFKTLLAFLAGATCGILVVLALLTRPFLDLLATKEAGLAIIVLLPVAVVYVIGAGLTGGVVGILIYCIRSLFARKRTK